MKKAIIPALIGLAAGAIDLIPLILAKAPLFNMVAVLVFWVVTCIIISFANILKKPFANGMLISIMMMLPMALAVAATNTKDFLPMMLMAVLLGPVVGFLIGRFSRSG